jgi:GLPGLI family protein
MIHFKQPTFVKILAFFFTVNIAGQQINGNISYPPGEYNADILDTSQLNVTYRYTFVKDSKEKLKKKSSLTLLQVGKKYSKFTDTYNLKRDSIHKVFSNLETIGVNEINSELRIVREIGFQRNIIKNLENNSIAIQGKVNSTKYEYKIPTPKFAWELKNKRKKILGYNARSAQLSFAGRNWTAWYTEEIPVDLGPYYFGGLPGLIIELHDDNENFHFTMIGLNEQPEQIFKRVEKNIFPTSRKEFLTAEKNFHERPELYIKGNIRGGSRFKKIPYNPIELVID